MNLRIYCLKRIAYIVPILFGVSLIIFFIFHQLMADPAIIILGPKHVNAERIASFHATYGLDRPLLIQYFDYIKSVLTLNFGTSWSTQREITAMISDGIWPSLSLTLPIFIIGNMFSIGTALLIAFFRGKFIDKLVLVISIATMSIPALVYILFGQWFFAYKLSWFEIAGFERSLFGFAPYIALPVSIGLLINWGGDTRFYRSCILDEAYKDYVVTARSKGVHEFRILYKHILKNAMIPILTNTVVQIPFLILGMFLFESFFGIPGIGGLTIDAIGKSDLPVIRAMTMFSSIAYVIFNTFSDILYVLVDPRVKFS